MQQLLQDFQNVSSHSGALRNKGFTLKNENVLCWLDNGFVLAVIKTAYVTFAFRSKPCCNIFFKFNIRVFCFYVLWQSIPDFGSYRDFASLHNWEIYGPLLKHH